MRKRFLFLGALLFAVCLYGQSADVITEILNTKEASYGQVCYLAAVAQDLIDESAGYADAVQALFEDGQLPEALPEDSAVSARELARIYARTWGVKGGLLLRIFKDSPRYAFKQLKSDGVIQKKQDPSAGVSGAEALNIYMRGLITYEGMTLDDLTAEEE